MCIGIENDYEVFVNCSLIIVFYLLDGEVLGLIGILGFIWMDYVCVIYILNILFCDLMVMLMYCFK